MQETQIEFLHQLPGLVVRHLPQAHHQRPSAGQGERATQPQYAFAIRHLAQPGLASRQDHHLRVEEAQAGDVFRKEETVLSLRRQRSPPQTGVGAGEGDAGAQQRVLVHLQGQPGEIDSRYPRLIILPKETVRSQVKDAGRSMVPEPALQPAFEGLAPEPGVDAQQLSNTAPFGLRACEASESGASLQLFPHPVRIVL